MKKIISFSIFIILVSILCIGYISYPKLDLISGFSSKSSASCHFIDGRSLDEIESGDNDISKIDWATNTIDASKKSVAASVYGLKTRTAIYREGLGATLIDDSFDVSKPYLVPNRKNGDTIVSFPFGNKDPEKKHFSSIDYKKLDTAVANAFDKKGEKNKRTRSVLVVYKDQIIAEKYAQNFDKESKLLGWSMTKSITATLFGILQKQGKIDIHQPAPIKEWAADNRSKITISDLLHMNSGLEWEENYETICDATKMLFQSADMTRSQLEKPAAFKPNTHWNYSSGTTNLLSGILRTQFQNHQDYLDFWYAELIDKIGMNSMLIETDMSGNYVGSSYGWATTRDWSKFGLLYLHQGNWNGEQLFDPSWVSYTTTPTPTSNDGYGAHFWLNAGGKFPDAPRDLYYCSGYQGQMIAIIPSLDMVIVRLGLKENPAFNFNGFLKGIISAVKK